MESQKASYLQVRSQFLKGFDATDNELFSLSLLGGYYEIQLSNPASPTPYEIRPVSPPRKVGWAHWSLPRDPGADPVTLPGKVIRFTYEFDIQPLSAAQGVRGTVAGLGVVDIVDILEDPSGRYVRSFRLFGYRIRLSRNSEASLAEIIYHPRISWQFSGQLESTGQAMVLGQQRNADDTPGPLDLYFRGEGSEIVSHVEFWKEDKSLKKSKKSPGS